MQHAEIDRVDEINKHNRMNVILYNGVFQSFLSVCKIVFFLGKSCYFTFTHSGRSLTYKLFLSKAIHQHASVIHIQLESMRQI